MARYINLRYSELVWEDREIAWAEEDYKEYLDKIKNSKWREDQDIYAVLKDVTWDQVCSIFNDEADDIEFKIHSKDYNSDEFIEQKTSVYKWLDEVMREEVYDGDVVNTSYADDSYTKYTVDTIED